MKRIKTFVLVGLLASTTAKAELETHSYKATIVNVYSGDTVTADIDLGFNVWVKNVEFKLNRVTAPNMQGDSRPKGLIARDWLKAKIHNRNVILKPSKDGNHNRLSSAVEVYLADENINDWLIKRGLVISKPD